MTDREITSRDGANRVGGPGWDVDENGGDGTDRRELNRGIEDTEYEARWELDDGGEWDGSNGNEVLGSTDKLEGKSDVTIDIDTGSPTDPWRSEGTDDIDDEVPCCCVKSPRDRLVNPPDNGWSSDSQRTS